MAETVASGLSILVADDESATRTTVAFVLKRAGHAVELVPSGEDALRRILEAPDAYQILITDHAMREMDGLRLVEQVKATGYQGDIIVLSAFVSLEIRSAYQRLGVTRFVTKPFDLSELRKAVNTIIAHE